MFEIGFACISHTYLSPYRISSPHVDSSHETPTAAPDESSRSPASIVRRTYHGRAIVSRGTIITQSIPLEEAYGNSNGP